ncbi:MAG: hypothetical protein HFG27_04655 [Provencibacterium sp.]|nr:hypothetical protein [Provencibacterium sp.]
MGKAGHAKKRKKYRLKPQAKRFYKRALLVIGLVLVATLALRFTVFRKTFTLYGYNASQPFEVQSLLLEKINPKQEENLILMDLTLRTNSSAEVTSFQLDMIELISNERYQEWTLQVSGGRAKLRKGSRASGNLTEQKNRFPSIQQTTAALGRIPLLSLVTNEKLSGKQQLEFTTKNYRPNVNPTFSDKAGEGVSIMWVAATGSTSSAQADWIPYTNYMALDCAVYTPSEDTSIKKYVILLETV